MSDRITNRRLRGLRIRGHRGHPEVRSAFIRFARWLRTARDFPVLLPVYLIPRDHIRSAAGRLCPASFFAPDSPLEVPFVRVATGDFPKLRRSDGRDAALAAFLCSLAHELVHYDQWLAREALTERGVAKKARRTVSQYNMAVDHP